MKSLSAINRIGIILILVLFFSNCYSQDVTITIPQKQKTSFKDRIFTGGNIGLQFGTVTFIDISPKIGYMITDKLGAGIGATYIYINDKRYPGYSYSTDVYGGRVFGQYQLLENIMAYSEFEVLNAEVQNDLTYKLSRQNISSLLAGGGYTQSIGAHSNAVILVLWNLLESRYSFYQNPIIRIGFNIGF